MAIEEVDFAFLPKWRRRSASLTLSPSLIMDSFSRKSLSHGRLPHQPLGLTIRKLDGSSFDIEVVDGELQLKEAVEDFFQPRNKISWPHFMSGDIFAYALPDKSCLVKTGVLKITGSEMVIRLLVEESGIDFLTSTHLIPISLFVWQSRALFIWIVPLDQLSSYP